MDTHVLRPVPPLRAYLIAALLAAVGAAAIVAGSVTSVDWLRWLGLVALVVGVGLVIVATVLVRRMRVQVNLRADGYSVFADQWDGGTIGSGGKWEDVTKVTRSADGTRLTLHQGPDKRTVLVGREVGVLADDITRHLDRSRGYRTE